MDKKEFATLSRETLQEILDLIEKKGREYANEDAFSNFKRASGGLSYHDKPEMVAWEYATKHFQSIKDIISESVPSSDAVVKEKVNDAIAYLLIIKAMLLEKEQKSSIRFTSTIA